MIVVDGPVATASATATGWGRSSHCPPDACRLLETVVFVVVAAVSFSHASSCLCSECRAKSSFFFSSATNNKERTQGAAMTMTVIFLQVRREIAGTYREQINDTLLFDDGLSHLFSSRNDFRFDSRTTDRHRQTSSQDDVMIFDRCIRRLSEGLWRRYR